jgi:hypothetical protein
MYHSFLPDKQLHHLFRLATFDEYRFFGLPARGSLLLPLTQEPLGILTVGLALAQVHLDEALDDEWIKYGHLRTDGDQVVGHGQVVRASGFQYIQACRPAAAHQLPKPHWGIGHFQVLQVRPNLVAHG